MQRLHNTVECRFALLIALTQLRLTSVEDESRVTAGQDSRQDVFQVR